MLRIYTLGSFDIKYRDESILDSKGYPYRTLRLFKYFLTHEGQKLLPETIIDDLFGSYDYKDPNAALRTQISRVRNMIELKPIELEDLFQIEFKNGYYIFKLDKNCILDIKEFDEKKEILKCEDISKEDEDRIIKILSLYRGDYLQELKDEDWIVPIRSRISRVYLKSLQCFLRKLKESKRYDDIVLICEDALQFNFYEEAIHIYYLEALVALGQKDFALSHYQYYTSKFYHDLGVSPSEEGKKIYKSITNQQEKTHQILDLDTMDKELNQDVDKGAFMCEPEYFKFLYKLKMRQSERNNSSNICLGILTIDNAGVKPLNDEDLKLAMDSLKKTLLNRLRKGDVFSQWNDRQLVFCLHDVKNMECIMDRLKNKFELNDISSHVSVNIKCKHL